MPVYLTVDDVCAMLKLSERTVYGLCRRGKLAGAAKIGRQWRVDRELLVAWMTTGGAAGTDQLGSREEEPSA